MNIMSRRKPLILLEHTDEDTGKSTQILHSTHLYIVLYKNKPFNLKLVNKMFDYPGPKYKKTSFSNPAHAYNLAERLNAMFQCDDFHVIVIDGEVN